MDLYAGGRRMCAGMWMFAGVSMGVGRGQGGRPVACSHAGRAGVGGGQGLGVMCFHMDLWDLGQVGV
jgi:hypothetical protein